MFTDSLTMISMKMSSRATSANFGGVCVNAWAMTPSNHADTSDIVSFYPAVVDWKRLELKSPQLGKSGTRQHKVPLLQER